MATDAAMGRRRARAIERIESRAKHLAADKPLVLPRYSRHGTQMLLIVQLEMLADYIEAAVPLDYTVFSVADLRAQAKERGIELGSAKSKPDIIALLQAADQPQEAST